MQQAMTALTPGARPVCRIERPSAGAIPLNHNNDFRMHTRPSRRGERVVFVAPLRATWG
jgi:hypothetical protein